MKSRPWRFAAVVVAACLAWPAYANSGASDAEFTEHLQRGIELLQQGDAARALIESDKAVRAAKQNANLARAHLLRAWAKEAMGDHRGAIDDATHAFTLDPNNAQAFNTLGLAHANLGDTAAALSALSQAIKLDPSLAQAYINRSLVKERLGDFRGMKDDSEQAIKLQPGNSWAYNNRGWAQWKLGAAREALADFAAAVKIEPKNATAYVNRAVVKEKLGDQPGAMEDLARAAAIQPELGDPAKVNERVLNLYHAGRYDEALPWAHWGIEQANKVLGPEHPETATALYNLAELYSDSNVNIKAYRKAEPLYRRALAIREKTLGPEHPLVATTLDNFGLLYFSTGEYHRAEPLLQRALAIREKVLSRDHPDIAQSLNDLAGLYSVMLQLDKAEPLFKRALAIRERTAGPGSPEVTQPLSNLAGVYVYLGRYTEAEPLYQRVLKIREKAYGPEHPAVADALQSLGALHLTMGRGDTAEPLFRRALTIQEKKYGPAHPQIAALLSQVARQYKAARQYDKAVPFLERALAIREKALGPNHQDVADSLDELARWYVTIGEEEKAEPILRRMLAIREKALGKENALVAASLRELGNLYVHNKRYAEAEPLLARALAIQEKTLGPEGFNLTATLDDLAGVYNGLGRGPQAEALYRRALTIREKAAGADNPSVGASLNNLGTHYYLSGEYARAVPLLRRALDIQEKAGGREDLPVTAILINLASVAAAQGEPRPAFGWYQRSMLISDRYIRSIFAATTEQQKLQFMQAHSQGYFSFLSLVHQYLQADRDAVKGALEAVLRRKGIVFDVEARTREALQGRLSESARQEWARLTQLRSELANMVLSKEKSLEPEVYKFRLAALHLQIEQAEQRLARESVLVAGELQQYTVTVGEVAKRLAPKAALVEFAKIQDFDFAKGRWRPSWRYLAFVLNTTGDVTLVDLGEAGTLESKAHRLLEDVRISVKTNRRDHIQKSLLSLKDFYGRAWAPLAKALGAADKVIVSPDDQLNLVPFAALIDDGGRPLVERYQLAYVSSGREIIAGGGEALKPDSELLLVANPAFDKIVSGSDNQRASLRSRDFRGVFDPLPGTEREAKEIPALVSGRGGAKNVLVGANATEGAVKSTRSPRILHLATHGFFLEDDEPATGQETRQPGRQGGAKRYENPLVRSGLAFAGANHASAITTGDDGILTALEITGMDLLGAELVVLSACETGVGEVKTGEGVFGLRRAFALAGARNLLMSLWPVNDELTAAHMKAFYNNLQRMPPAQALREAQLEAIRTLKAEFNGVAPPGHWAPFILQGAYALGP